MTPHEDNNVGGSFHLGAFDALQKGSDYPSPINPATSQFLRIELRLNLQPPLSLWFTSLLLCLSQTWGPPSLRTKENCFESLNSTSCGSLKPSPWPQDFHRSPGSLPPVAFHCLSVSTPSQNWLCTVTVQTWSSSFSLISTNSTYSKDTWIFWRPGSPGGPTLCTEQQTI